MLKQGKYFSLTVFFATLLFYTCTSPKEAYHSKENLYKKTNQELNTKLLAYHINDSVTQIYFSLDNENLLYKRPDTSNMFYAAVKIRFATYTNGKTKQVLDTGGITILDRQGDKFNPKTLKGYLFSKCRMGQSYLTEIAVYDLNKKTRTPYVLDINKTSSGTRQSFLVQKNDGTILYDNHLIAGDTIVVKSFINTETNFVVDYFKHDFPLAPPPFSLVERPDFEYKPDSFFVINRTSGILRIIIPEKGFYHIVTEKETKNGLSLFSVDASFPGIKDETEMIKCIRYITTSDEYKTLLNSTNKKAAIDDFWKDKGGSNERAKELLKKYYSRVQHTNKLFTSFQPGWQTDRGMIYIVFGAPTKMYKYATHEIWIYGLESATNSLRFNFQKIANPFSENYFLLERNDYYKFSWYQAVTGWKEGRVFMDN
jgi:GWxTD domain-containing protein